MTNHKIHDTLPDGFHFADRLQVESFMDTGSVDGAAKVCLVAGEGDLPRLACRLRPPRGWTAAMINDYKCGWIDGKASTGSGDAEADSPYGQGYRDAAEGRMRWHLAYCKDHGDHEGGCAA